MTPAATDEPRGADVGAPSITLESSLPESLAPGAALALYCSGSAWGGRGPVAELALMVEGVRHPVSHVRMPRFDLPRRRSGWWAVVPVRASRQGVEIRGELTLADGSRRELALARIPPTAHGAPTGVASVGMPPAGPDELIAVCMATFDPDPELLRAQIASLRAQTDRRWTCVISDDGSSPEHYADIESVIGTDSRFLLSPAPGRIGFYRNFERALSLAPPQARLIALCDQDDVWHPDKLSSLRSGIGSAALIYSDQRLVDERGTVLRSTMWRGRSNNTTSLASMLIANTVTGASAMFTREVLERALPFPDSPGIEFHDHWVALVALATGRLAYLDRPLYDYVQHSRAILGKVTGSETRAAAARARRRGRIRMPLMREWRAAYFLGYIPGAVRARTLLLRCSDRLAEPQRRALNRYLRCEDSTLALAWFVLRPVRLLAGRTETLGGEWELALGLLWARLARLVARLPSWPERGLLDARFPDPPHFEQKRLRRWRERM